MKRFLIYSALIFSFLLLVSWIGTKAYLDTFVKNTIERKFSKILGVPVKTEEVFVSLRKGRVKISHLDIANPENFLSNFAFRVKEAEIQLKVFSLFSDKVEVEHIKVFTPEVNYEYNAMGKNNISTISSAIKQKPSNSNTANEAPKSKKKQKKFVINDLHIKDVIISASAGIKLASFKIDQLHMTNIGYNEQGITANQVFDIIMSQLLGNIESLKVKDVKKNLTKQLNKEVKKLEDKFVKETNKLIEGLIKNF